MLKAALKSNGLRVSFSVSSYISPSCGWLNWEGAYYEWSTIHKLWDHSGLTWQIHSWIGEMQIAQSMDNKVILTWNSWITLTHQALFSIKRLKPFGSPQIAQSLNCHFVHIYNASMLPPLAVQMLWWLARAARKRIHSNGFSMKIPEFS